MNFKLSPPVGNKILLSELQSEESNLLPLNPMFFESGTASLSIAISIAIKSRPDVKTPKVILPGYACPDLISAAKAAGAYPQLVDLAPDSYQYEIAELENAIDTDTVAIVFVSFLGLKNNIDILSKEQKRNLLIIEDSAQGFPRTLSSEYWNGDLTICSFGRGKPLSLLGGGAVFVNNPLYVETAREFQLKPISSSFSQKLIYKLKVRLHNFLLNPFCYFWLTKIKFLKIGATKYSKLESINACSDYILGNMQINIEAYSAKTQMITQYTEGLKNIKSDQLVDLVLNSNFDNETPLLRYPILIKNLSIRNKLLTSLLNNGIGASPMYKNILPEIEGVEVSDYQIKGELKNAKDFANSLITLPLNEQMDNKQVRQVVEIIAKELE